MVDSRHGLNLLNISIFFNSNLLHICILCSRLHHHHYNLNLIPSIWDCLRVLFHVILFKAMLFVNPLSCLSSVLQSWSLLFYSSWRIDLLTFQYMACGIFLAFCIDAHSVSNGIPLFSLILELPMSFLLFTQS